MSNNYYLWSNASSRCLVATLRGHVDGVSAVHFWNTSQYLISGDYSGNLKLWDIHQRVACWTDEKTHNKSAIMQIYSSPFAMESFYAHDKTGLVVEYKLVGGSMVKTSQTTTNNDIPWRAVQKFSTGFIGICRGSMFHNLLAVATSIPQDLLVIYDISQSLEKPIISFDYNPSGHCGLCTLVGFIDEQVVMTLHEDGSIKLWSLNRQEMIQHLKVADAGTLLSFDIYGKHSSSGITSVWIGGSKKILVLLEWDGHKLKEEYRQVVLKRSGLGDVVVRQDERILAVAHWDAKVRLYEIQNNFRQLATLPHDQR